MENNVETAMRQEIDELSKMPVGQLRQKFTVENANFQGIIVQNASFVTVYDNQVLNNNKSLVTTGSEPTCPGLPAALASGEAQDCGEGINLTGADHSVVSNNVVQHNSGGILVSDDTGAAQGGPLFSDMDGVPDSLSVTSDRGVTPFRKHTTCHRLRLGAT
jgi:parallel beta-helix repeat protein